MTTLEVVQGCREYLGERGWCHAPVVAGNDFCPTHLLARAEFVK